MDIAFDIETIPNAGMIDRLPAIEVKAGNLKDPAKIAEKEAAAKAEQIDKMALSPLYGRVCAWVSQSDKICNSLCCDCITADSDAEETRVIENAFKALSGSRVITYNGNGFDLPFLYRRAVLLGIDPRRWSMPTLAEMTARYNNKRHVDLMQVWCGFGQFEKLDNIAGAILDDHKIEIDFRDFPEMIKTIEGRDKLLAYCHQDVSLTKKLWNRISGILI